MRGGVFCPNSAALLGRREAAARRPEQRVWEHQGGKGLLPSLFLHLAQELCLGLSPESASTAQGAERLLERLWLHVSSLQERPGLLPSFGAASEGGGGEQGGGRGLRTPVARAEKQKQKQNRGIYFPWKIIKMKGCQARPCCIRSDCTDEDKVATFIAGRGEEGQKLGRAFEEDIQIKSR